MASNVVDLRHLPGFIAFPMSVMVPSPIVVTVPFSRLLDEERSKIMFIRKNYVQERMVDVCMEF